MSDFYHDLFAKRTSEGLEWPEGDLGDPSPFPLLTGQGRIEARVQTDMQRKTDP